MLNESFGDLNLCFLLKFTRSMKTGETHFEMTIFGSNTYFFLFFPMFVYFTLSVKAFKQFVPEVIYSSPTIIMFFLCELLLLA